MLGEMLAGISILAFMICFDGANAIFRCQFVIAALGPILFFCGSKFRSSTILHQVCIITFAIGFHVWYHFECINNLDFFV
jgi:hypothetical protein